MTWQYGMIFLCLASGAVVIKYMRDMIIEDKELRKAENEWLNQYQSHRKAQEKLKEWELDRRIAEAEGAALMRNAHEIEKIKGLANDRSVDAMPAAACGGSYFSINKAIDDAWERFVP